VAAAEAAVVNLEEMMVYQAVQAVVYHMEHLRLLQVKY
jgi:hypothetical protein